MKKIEFIKTIARKELSVVLRLHSRLLSKINSIILKSIYICKKFLIAAQQKNRSQFLALKFKAIRNEYIFAMRSERGDVPGWVLVVLMTTGLVTGIWTVAQPRLSSILKNSLDNMNSIR